MTEEQVVQGQVLLAHPELMDFLQVVIHQYLLMLEVVEEVGLMELQIVPLP